MTVPAVSEAQALADVLDVIPDGVVVVDAAGAIRMVNAQAGALFGYAPAELIGEPVERLVPHAARRRHTGQRSGFSRHPHLRRMGEVTQGLAGVRRDGSEVPVDIALGHISSPAGPLAVAFIRDYSGTRALLDELSRARDRLERELDQRRQLRTLSELLQMPLSRDDLRPELQQQLEGLFPGTGGALFILDQQGELAEPLVTWGFRASPPAFRVNECQAVGPLHEPGGHAPHGAGGCAHLRAHAAMDSRCVPLEAGGETLGVLSVSAAEHHALAPADVSKIDAVADWLGLPVANLRLRERLQDLSHRDPLTGLFNRRHLDTALPREAARAARHEVPLALALIDLDHFKRLNDSFGHGAGDAVLRAFASFIRASFRTSDVVCRYGGEEFVVVCPDCSGAQLEGALDRLRAHWADTPVTGTPGDSRLSCTFSAGVAEYPEAGRDPAALLHAADVALYRAKALGRDRIERQPTRRTTAQAPTGSPVASQ